VKEFLKPGPDRKEHPTQSMSADDWRDDWRLERLINRAPSRIRSTVHFLRQPSRRWLRIPAGLLFTAGGVLWFLPIAGLWMLPIGLALLAEDVPPLRSLRRRTLDWIECHRPDWLAHRSHSQ
jgi:hypothetical protein